MSYLTFPKRELRETYFVVVVRDVGIWRDYCATGDRSCENPAASVVVVSFLPTTQNYIHLSESVLGSTTKQLVYGQTRVVTTPA